MGGVDDWTSPVDAADIRRACAASVVSGRVEPLVRPVTYTGDTLDYWVTGDVVRGMYQGTPGEECFSDVALARLCRQNPQQAAGHPICASVAPAAGPSTTEYILYGAGALLVAGLLWVAVSR